MIANELLQLQENIRVRLKERESISVFDPIREDRKDIETAIKTAVAKIGLAVIIGTAEANVTKPNLPGPYFDQIRFQVDILENPVINRAASGSGIDALSVAVEVTRTLHLQPSGIGGSVIYCDNPTIVYRDDRALLIYSVNFKIGT